MKFKIIPTTLAIVIFTITIVGSTYAFFTATVSANNAVVTSAKELQVIYSGGTEISGTMSLAANKDQGKSTTLSIKVAEGSVQAKATISLVIDNICEELATNGFIWEVVGTKDGTKVYENSGTLAGTENDDQVDIVEDYLLDFAETEFVVYLWLDGSKYGNEVIGKSFGGHIIASSEPFTAELD